MENWQAKKAKVLAYLIKLYDTMDPSGSNTARIKNLIEPMGEQELQNFYDILASGREVLYVTSPNSTSKSLKYVNVEKAAILLGVKLFHRLRMVDPVTGIEFITPEEYAVLELPYRRQQQTIDEKLSVPKYDKRVDSRTNQVTGDDRACSITDPEIQANLSKGLKQITEEFVVYRGGNTEAYATARYQAEETGRVDVDLDTIGTRARSADVTKMYFLAMGYAVDL
jgi:hypothetical protein